VSTDKQEREETVASQVDLLQQAAETHGYAVLPGKVFIDDGISGTRLDRPALDRLRDLAAEGAFEVMLVTTPDRLARRYAYQVVLVEEFTRCGCEVVLAQQSLGTSPAEQMRLQMQGVFAEYERAVIQERMRRGRVFAARQGRVNWGNPPDGDTDVRKTVATPQHLVINETEAEVVRQIYRWCVEEPMSSYALHRCLTAQGIPPRKASPRGWAQRRVIEILRDSLYTGEAYDNRTQPGDVRWPKTDWIPVRVPALIDPETWEQAQTQLVRNRERAQRHNTQHPYLLRSLLVCGRCGRRMVGTWSAQGERYLCALRSPRYVPGACLGRSLGATTIESQVWDHVKTLLSDPEVLRRHDEQGHGDPAVDVHAEQERARLERKLTVLDREVTRLIDAYQAEVIELAELAERRHRIEDHGRLLRERVREIAQQRVDRAAEWRLLEGVDAFCASVRGAMEESTFHRI
jgi:site-specific DNA recombinase